MPTTATEQEQVSVDFLLEWSTACLASKEIESPRLTAELLLSHVLRCDRLHLSTHFDEPVAFDQVAKFRSFTKRRLSHEPLQYITGVAEFMGLRFIVDRRVLIPRPETEILVEEVIKFSRNQPETVHRVLDIGTGSGNIAISLAKLVSGCTVDALDVSEEALSVARRNIELHEVEDSVHLIQGDILMPMPGSLDREYDVIVSNPPYISKEEFALLEPDIKEFEPHIATTDGSDGLTFFRAIARKAKNLLRSGGWLFVEIAYDQRESVSDLFRSEGYANVDTISDYSACPRVVKAQWL